MDYKQAAKVIKEGFKSGGKVIIQKVEEGYLVSDTYIMFRAPGSFLDKFDRKMIPEIPSEVGQSMFYTKTGHREGPNAEKLLLECSKDTGRVELSGTGIHFIKSDSEILIHYGSNLVIHIDKKYKDIFCDEQLSTMGYKQVIIAGNNEEGYCGMVMPVILTGEIIDQLITVGNMLKIEKAGTATPA